MISQNNRQVKFVEITNKIIAAHNERIEEHRDSLTLLAREILCALDDAYQAGREDGME